MKIYWFPTTSLSLFPSSFFLNFFLRFQCFHSFSPFWFMKWNNFPDHQTLSGFWGALHRGRGGREGSFFFNQRILKYQSSVTRQYSYISKYNTKIWADFFRASAKPLVCYKLSNMTTIDYMYCTVYIYGWDLVYGWDLAECMARASDCKVLGLIPASSDTVESEGRQMKQCRIKYCIHQKIPRFYI